jgi:hypothetical protein
MRSPATPLASATTVDLATADGDYVSVTGDVAITGLGTVSAGMRFLLRFADGGAVLTHNAASLILPGNANITTAGGDIAWMQSLGSGNWKCLVYQKADGTPVIKTTTTASISDIASGTYTPTYTLTTNTTSASGDLAYVRIGNIVTVSGVVTVAASGVSAAVTFHASLPVASNFTDTTQLSGTGIYSETVPARILANTTSDNAEFKFTSSTTSSIPVRFSFTYQIL